MKVKYIGLSDSRKIASADLPQLFHEGDEPLDMGDAPEGEDEGSWVLDWAPDQVHEVDDRVGRFLVGSMKNEFRDLTEYNTDADLAEAEEVQDDDVEAEPPRDAYWDLQEAKAEDTDDAVDREIGVQPGWLDADQLDTGTSKSVLITQMNLRKLDSDGMTRRAMLDAIIEHDASGEAPEDA